MANIIPLNSSSVTFAGFAAPAGDGSDSSGNVIFTYPYSTATVTVAEPTGNLFGAVTQSVALGSPLAVSSRAVVGTSYAVSVSGAPLPRTVNGTILFLNHVLDIAVSDIVSMNVGETSAFVSSVSPPPANGVTVTPDLFVGQESNLAINHRYTVAPGKAGPSKGDPKIYAYMPNPPTWGSDATISGRLLVP